MDVIHYAGDTFLTGTDIAHSLLAYARALASQADSATVDIPTRNPDGSPGKAEFLIGPASQLVTETIDTTAEELVAPEVVARLELATRALGSPAALPFEADYTATSSSDLDLDVDLDLEE